MTIIDAHTHFYPEYVAADSTAWARKNGEFYWAELVGKRPDGKLSLQGFPSEKKFLDDMDTAGVNRAIIQGWYWEHHETCIELNAAISKLLRAHGDRFSAFAAAQPADARFTDIVKSARDSGFCGIGELHNGVQKFDFNSGTFKDFVELCTTEKLPICIHLTEESLREYRGKVSTDNDSAMLLAKKFPRENFIFAHWFGGRALNDNFNARETPNAFFDSAANPFIGGERAWKLGTRDAENLAIYGSDYPLRLYPRKFKTEEMLTIVSEARANIDAQFAPNFFEKNIENLIF